MRHTSMPNKAGITAAEAGPRRYPAAGGALRSLLLAIALLAAVPASYALEPGAAGADHTSGVVGVTDLHLDPQYWVRQQPQPNRIILDADAIAAQNARLQQQDRSVHDVEQLAARFSAAQIREWIAPLSAAPTRALFDAQGQTVPAETLSALQQALALDRIAETTAARYGLVVHRADLRTFPTRLRVFNSPGDTDIDRFQESALFPGTPVVVIHESSDGQWLFVVSRLYAAWIEKRHVALGERETVFGYGRKQPALIVTGATARTVYNPEQPGVSELQLDMGVRVPLLADWPADKPVNGQHPYTSHVIQLPVRGDDGGLTLVPALLPRTADVASEYLPLTPANLLNQSFKFLGERYGWGHSYNTRDCSGFVSEVYRSFGIELPRNTRDQGVSPALNRIAFDENDSREQRLKVLRTLQVGDLIYIPGHVMMVIGQDNGQTYLIHDTTGITYRSDGGEIVRAPLNSVAVTPLEPLLFNGEQSFVDRIYSIQRIRP